VQIPARHWNKSNSRRESALASCNGLLGGYLQVIRGEPSALRDAREHSGPDVFAVMEREDEVGPTIARENPVRPSLAYDAPSNAEERRENRARLGRRPIRHG
jgi:hypothetical protein